MDFAAYPLSLIFFASIVGILTASEIGRRFGLLNSRRSRQNISTLEGSILGLLALMIGFTFAMALSGFEQRRGAVLNEANAISTTASRARLLPAPHSTECIKLLREYVQVRLEITRRVLPPKENAAAISRSRAIQEALWQQAKAVAVKNNAMVPTGLFIQALNEMFDRHEARHAVFLNRVPNTVLTALYGLAIVASAFAGYAAGLDAQRSRLPIYTMGALVSIVIFLIQDIDRPGPGLITVSQQPMLDAAASIAEFAD
ncbi:MAG: hypothetical protein Q7J60_02315 [Bradyrhizobium sp.]|uniref:bestrophin-like domain n=1 Tax=Bradyrhizobium sp. TaxID=376 RepID=UPI0027238162|nr:hypothetical protein [Bradyrhizobium sp.]MDO9560435.1 hypothetical protein [Bradyrhizobium sp.]MDP3692014.1 hypothetical protein [Bradyrhizobium sp.]